MIITNEQIIASSLDGTIKVFDIRMGECVSDDILCGIHSFDNSNDG
jgi:hypothetical protein